MLLHDEVAFKKYLKKVSNCIDMSHYQVLGLMSGTSLDGLDIACCKFYKDNHRWQFEIQAAKTYPYSAEWTDKLKRVTEMDGLELTQTDLKLGHWMGEQCQTFLKEHNLKADFVASHGHTVFHQPLEGLTLQIGNGHSLRQSSGLPAIADFRSWDVVLGGQGAPLVPIGDRHLFADYGVCLNIGGIANLSAEVQGKRIAYDICGANMVLNQLAQRAGKSYDEGGKMASTGRLDESLFGQLESLAFYKEAPPKSLGYEWVTEKVMPLINSCELSIPDLLCTYCHHIGARIAEETGKLLKPQPDKMPQLLVTGGGAFNTYLINCIRQYSENKFSTYIPTDLLVNYKEALIFAFLGVLRVNGETNVLKEVTGAPRNNSGGVIYGFIPDKIL